MALTIDLTLGAVRACPLRKARAFQTVTRAIPEPGKQAIAARTQPPLTITPAELRKFMMTTLGWEESWSEIISRDVKRRGLKVSPKQCDTVVKYFTGMGIPSASVCNMVTMTEEILVEDVATQLQPVVQYIQQQGVEGPALARLLATHPHLLTYSVSADSKRLERGRARASVEVHGDAGVVGVSYWSEGTSFGSAPLSPHKPAALSSE